MDMKLKSLTLREEHRFRTGCWRKYLDLRARSCWRL